MNGSDERSSPAPGRPPQLASEDRLAWVALTLTPGLGPKRILKAAQALPDMSQLFHLALTELESLNFPAEAAQFLFTGKARIAAEQELLRVGEQGGAILTYEDPEYPDRLREIFDPPPVLWALGDMRLLSRPSIAIVGTRHPTPYGTGMAELLARDLASRRMVILSGMARGRLSVGATPSLITRVLAPALVEFHGSHPGIDLLVVEAGSGRGTAIFGRAS